MKNLFTLFLFGFAFFTSCSKKDINAGYSGNTGRSTYPVEKNVGYSAKDLLSSATYTSLRIEIQYMPGYTPDANAIDHLKNVLNDRLNKPGGIEIVQKQITASSLSVLSVNDIINIEKQNRTAFTNNDQLCIYFLVTNGDYTDKYVLGVAYRNTSMCLFGKTMFDHSGGVGQANRTKLEATVLEHELGHILGLVNISSPMQTVHEDASHSHHCSNNNCMMYYASETTDILGFLITGNIPSYDIDCLNDLKENGGK